MAKAKKVVEDNKEETNIEEPVNLSVSETEVMAEEKNEEPILEKPVYIPDIPAQMIEPDSSNEIETEVDFLLRILQIQEDGCFGRHLNKIIQDRIKLIG